MRKHKPLFIYYKKIKIFEILTLHLNKNCRKKQTLKGKHTEIKNRKTSLFVCLDMHLFSFAHKDMKKTKPHNNCWFGIRETACGNVLSDIWTYLFQTMRIY